MIKYLLIINTQGKVRVSKYYDVEQRRVEADVIRTCLKREKTQVKMSRLMGKPTICICENKGADQLHGIREADLRLCGSFVFD